MLPKLPLVAPSLDFSNIWANFGIAIAAKIPIIATTIISSIKVKPFAFKRIIILLLTNFKKEWPKQSLFDPSQVYHERRGPSLIKRYLQFKSGFLRHLCQGL